MQEAMEGEMGLKAAGVEWDDLPDIDHILKLPRVKRLTALNIKNEAKKKKRLDMYVFIFTIWLGGTKENRFSGLFLAEGS